LQVWRRWPLPEKASFGRRRSHTQQ